MQFHNSQQLLEIESLVSDRLTVILGSRVEVLITREEPDWSPLTERATQLLELSPGVFLMVGEESLLLAAGVRGLQLSQVESIGRSSRCYDVHLSGVRLPYEGALCRLLLEEQSEFSVCKTALPLQDRVGIQFGERLSISLPVFSNLKALRSRSVFARFPNAELYRFSFDNFDGQLLLQCEGRMMKIDDRVEFEVTLGCLHASLSDVLALRPGSVIQLSGDEVLAGTLRLAGASVASLQVVPSKNEISLVIKKLCPDLVRAENEPDISTS